ncbi:hypothetical protein PAPYR_9085 [Paratrimastix pyriformis]|uniref:RING-type domain-containing protein n=1 Tax=Paratrimastix pyriformis TaxID=342808 RepID=A0ABQ8U980_9EUKA|nr:hypothetical protein PAPYR_9085 [Paratrimastix pyriformis]
MISLRGTQGTLEGSPKTLRGGCLEIQKGTGEVGSGSTDRGHRTRLASAAVEILERDIMNCRFVRRGRVRPNFLRKVAVPPKGQMAGDVSRYLALCLLPLVFAAAARKVSAADIANPRSHPEKCVPDRKLNEYLDVWGNEQGRLKPSWICDPYGFLRPGDFARLNDDIDRFYEHIVPAYEIGIALVRRNTGDIGVFARSVYDQWGVGEDGRGALLVMAIDHHEMFLATGRQTKKLIPDRAIDQLFDDMGPTLRREDYHAALSLAVDTMISRIEHPSLYKVGFWSRMADVAWWCWDHITLLVYPVIFIGALLASWFSEWADRRRARARLNRLDADLRSTSPARPRCATMCAICLEEFPPEHIRRMEQLCGIGIAALLPLLSPPLHTLLLFATQVTLTIVVLPAAADAPPAPVQVQVTPEQWEALNSGEVETLAGCGHQFHRACIEEWLRTHDQCPLCRQHNPRAPPLPPGLSPKPMQARLCPCSCLCVNYADSVDYADCGAPPGASKDATFDSEPIHRPLWIVRPRPFYRSDMLFMRQRVRYVSQGPAHQRAATRVSGASVRSSTRRSFGGGRSSGGGGRHGRW